MFGYSDISIDFLTGTPVLSWLALLVLVGVSVFLYYRTNPPLPSWLRILLGSLRVIAVLALAGALLEPVVSYSRQFERPPRVAVIVDASMSMSRSEEGKTRQERADSLLATDAYGRLNTATRVTRLYFGDSLATDAQLAGPDKTALGNTLYDLNLREMAEPSDYWLLLSDGRSNSGRDPVATAGELAVPVISVGMATTTGDFDVGLSEVDYNAVLFVGRPTEIVARLGWHNASGRTVEVELHDGQQVVARKELRIDQESGFGEVALRYIPPEPGQRLLRVSIPVDEEEKTTGNNTRTIAVKVLKSRINVLLVSQGPDYELGFLKRYLTAPDRYEVELCVLGSKAGNLGRAFPTRQAELNRYDLVILHDINPRRLDGRQEILDSYLSDRGGAVWTMMGTDYAGAGPVEWFNRLLPFHQSRHKAIDFGEFHGEPAEAELFHPVVRLSDDRSGIREAWGTLPPFKSVVRCDVVDPQAVILVNAALPVRSGQKLPVIGYRRFGPGKVLASSALPFWFWGYVNLGFGEDDSHYGKLLDGAVSWLTIPEDFDPVRVKPVKDVFNRGETVRFDGVAFDQGFRPIAGVTGGVRLVSDEDTEGWESDLVEQTGGRYVAEFAQIPPGKYNYTGVFEKDGEVLRENTGLIQVEAFSLEDFDQSGDPSTLAAVSRRTGGESFTFENFEEALQLVGRDPIVVTVAGESSIWNSLWLLIVFVVALAIEWGLRKLNHLL